MLWEADVLVSDRSEIRSGATLETAAHPAVAGARPQSPLLSLPEGSAACAGAGPTGSKGDHRHMAMRLEHDSLGTKEIPQDAYWGIHTARAIENFPISGIAVSEHPELVRALASVKQACARANRRLGSIGTIQQRLVDRACEEIRAGRLHDQFVVDVYQGGAGTSTNMNANEVIANRALEIAGRPRGDYDYVHPNDVVNRSQSTNDTYPTALRIALIGDLRALRTEAERGAAAFRRKADDYASFVTMGRTQLQDAVPMTFGQAFGAYASTLEAAAASLAAPLADLARVNLGGTAIGTGLTADPRFRGLAIAELSRLTGLDLVPAANAVAATPDVDAFAHVSSAVKRLALRASKIANDLRLLASGPQAGIGEVRLPARQAGSSIMPGKVNPVICEALNQTAFSVVGMDATVTMAAEAGQLQLNAFEPVMGHELMAGIVRLTAALRAFRELCVDGLTVNEEVARSRAESSASLVTSLIGYLGYATAAHLAQRAVREGRPVRELVAETGLIREEMLDDLLDPARQANVPLRGSLADLTRA